MEYLIIYIISVITSISIELIAELSIIKEIAQKGYKLDILSATDELTNYETKNNFLKKLIPIYNIIFSIKQTKKYKNIKEKLLENPSNQKTLVKMNDIEKAIFEEKPKSITALNLAVSQIDEENYRIPRGYITINNGIYRQVNNNGTYSQITFERSKDKIIIYSLEGEISKLDIEEQQKELNKIFNTLYNLNAQIETKSKITQEKEKLIEYKEKILEEKNEMKLKLK